MSLGGLIPDWPSRAPQRAPSAPAAPVVKLPPEIEAIVREKVKAGLTREQAIEVLRAQEAWDKAPETK